MRGLTDVTASPSRDAAAVPVGLSMPTTYLPELESLRGIAILLVYCFHTDGLLHFLVADRPEPSLPVMLVRVGGTGVDLFFVLSGFLLGLAFVVEAYGGRPIVLRHYFVRRALRILPLYWTTVALVTVLTAQNAGDLLRGVPHFLFLSLTIGWQPVIFPYSTVWWSLGTEVQFYLVLPAVRWLLQPGRKRRAAIGALMGYSLLYATALAYAATFPPGHRGDWIWSSLFGRLPGFLLGIVGAWAYFLYGTRARFWLHRSSWVRFGGADALLIGILFLLTLILRDVLRAGWTVAEVGPFQVYHVAAAALWVSFAGLVLLAPLRARPLLHNRLLGWLGTISYSIYLWHVPIVHCSLMLLRQRWPNRFHFWDRPTMLGMIGVTAATLMVSSLSYRFIERPFLAYKSRVGR